MVFATLLSSGECRAQEAAPADIVVTAEKRSDTVVNTPMSVTVVLGSTLRAIGVEDFAGLATQIPGLSYLGGGPGNKRYALRGLQSAGEPEVALYYDEIPVSGVPGGSLDTGDSQPDIKLWDIDRVEVLRGPQGTLYGNGAMGGAIRILSKRPVLGATQASAEASAGATSGGSPSWDLKSMLNVRLGESAAVRVTGYYDSEGGWIDDLERPDIHLPQQTGRNLNTERLWGGKVSALFEPTANWSIVALAYYQSMRTEGSFATYPLFATSADRYVSKQFVATPWIDRSQMYNLISRTDFGGAVATISASYQRRTLQRSLDTTRYLLSLSGCTVFTVNVTCNARFSDPASSQSSEQVSAWSAEARLVARDGRRFGWTLGAFVQDSSTFRDGQVVLIDPTAASGAQSDGTRLFARTNADRFIQYALFGEARYDIVPRLTVTVGGRWFHSDRSDTQTLVQQFFPSQPTGVEPTQRFSEGKLFKKLELSYSWRGKSILYAQAAQGFRAGGPNYPGGFDAFAPPYASDSVWDYEIGAKTSLANGRIFLDAAIFDIEWSRLQQLVPTQLFNYIANAGKARSTGFEAWLTVAPLPGLNLSAGLTYNDARLVGPQPVQTDPTLQLRAGDRLAGVPDWTARGDISYERSLAKGYLASARLDAHYQSGRTTSVARDSPAYFVLAPYVLADATLALAMPHRRRVSLGVINLLGQFAELSGKQLDANLVRTVTVARPRTIRLTLAADF